MDEPHATVPNKKVVEHDLQQSIVSPELGLCINAPWVRALQRRQTFVLELAGRKRELLRSCGPFKSLTTER